MTETERALAVLHETLTPQKALESVGAATSTALNTMFMAGLLSYHNPFEVNGGTRRLPVRQVLQISAVMLCLDILAQDIAKTTLRLYRKVPGGKAEVQPGEHPMAEMLALEPNQWHHWHELIEMMMLHLALHQNAFWYKRQTMSGQPIEFLPILPGSLDIQPQPERGGYAYRITKQSEHEKVMLSGVPDVLLDGEIIHFRGRMFDGLLGYSNLEAGAATFKQANEILQYQVRTYETDGATRGIFKMKPETQLSEEAYTRLKSDLGDAWRDFMRIGKPMLLEEGLDFTPLGMTAEQSESTKSFGEAVLNVARQFRIPPHKIFHLVNVKYENMETMEGSYVFDTLIPYAERIEARLKRDTLDRRDRIDFFYQFDREEMILHDPSVQAEMINVLLPNGALEIDEVRKMRGLNPLPNGAGRVRLIPSTYTVVDNANQVVLAAGGKTPEQMEAELAAKTAPPPAPTGDETDKAIPGLRVVS